MDTWLQIGMKGGLIVFIDLKPFLAHYIHVSDQHLALHCVWLHVNAPQIRTKISFCSSTMKLFFQQHGPTFPKKKKKKKNLFLVVATAGCRGPTHRRLINSTKGVPSILFLFAGTKKRRTAQQHIFQQLCMLLGSPNALWRANARAPRAFVLAHRRGTRHTFCHGRKAGPSSPSSRSSAPTEGWRAP